MQEVLDAEAIHQLALLLLPEMESLNDALPGFVNGSMYLTTRLQMKDLAGHLESLNVRGEFSDWRCVTVHNFMTREIHAFVVGDRGPRVSTVTSALKKIDLDSGLVQTQNSVYRIPLDQQGIGEPSLRQLKALRNVFSRP